nr:hypothetical protein [Tanacetum cinerariifolium]
LTAAAKGKQPARATSPTDPLESEEEETREEEEERFDLIPRTPEDDEDGEEDKGLRISEEERIQEEEEAYELYRDVNINQGRGLKVSQDIEDSHMTLTPVHPDGQQESSSVSSFMTSMLNSTSDAGVESIFTTASSPIAPLPTSTPIMTPSTIATITTSSEAPIPPKTIPSAVLENLPTFDSVFRFEDRVKSLEDKFSEFMQTNQFAEAVMSPSTIATITTSSEAPIPPKTIPSAVLENLPTFDSVFRFEDRVKSLEDKFSEFMQTNQFAEAVSKIS